MGGEPLKKTIDIPLIGGGTLWAAVGGVRWGSLLPHHGYFGSGKVEGEIRVPCPAMLQA